MGLGSAVKVLSQNDGSMCKLSLYHEHFNIRLVRGVKAWKRSKQRFVELYLLTNNPASLARIIVTNLISTAKCEPRD